MRSKSLNGGSITANLIGRGLVGHRLLLLMNLVVHKRKSNLARQNKSPSFCSGPPLRLAVARLATARLATAQNKTLPNCFGVKLQKRCYTN